MLQSVAATSGVREHFLLTAPSHAKNVCTGACSGVAVEGSSTAEGELTAAMRQLLLELHTGGAAVDCDAPCQMLLSTAMV